ncbi:hypothetical protein BDA99DRAFT_610347 [Phascolomyces articulosus]|uniref:Uncharacterized protein n=1 Tax=Phascolomyces articulosus TaxID=60185 RepID=A0AAD5JLH2_9FUNG|nr:hypothetical protein BDA99DRAFT_610347 [Phascolomyces articulosus]
MAMNSSVTAKSFRKKNCKRLVDEYVSGCKENNNNPSLKQFVLQELVHIAELTDIRQNPAGFWTVIFKKAVEDAEVEGVFEEEIDWALISAQRKKSEKPIPTSSSSSPHPPTASVTSRPTTTTKKSSILMSKEALDEVKNNYEKVIESGLVWELKSGRIVEQVMMDYSLGLKYEHPAHSLILTPDDPLYAEVFTEQELEEIGDFNSIDFDQKLPKDVHEYLYSFLDKKTLDGISTVIYNKTFKPLDQPDLYWIRKSIEEVVDLYNMNFFDSDYIEDDVEYRVWPFVFKCFDLTEIRARSGKRKSQASSARHNRNRTLPAHGATTRHRVGEQPDMKCSYLNYELGISEVALKDEGENGSKELHESSIRAPKMLKDFLTNIARERPSILHSIKTAAFIISGLHMSVIVLDCPKGSVCRVTQSERAAFPLHPHVCFPSLIPILELAYRTRLYLLDTVAAIKGDKTVVSLGKKGKKRASTSVPPPCITTTQSSPSSSTSTTSSKSDQQSSKKQKQQ